jgi:hypothetical protein
MASNTPNPRRTYATPAALIADTGLSKEEKTALLTEWNSELDLRLNAESEGMGASDPLSAKREASLAEEAKAVTSALTDVIAATKST